MHMFRTDVLAERLAACVCAIASSTSCAPATPSRTSSSTTPAETRPRQLLRSPVMKGVPKAVATYPRAAAVVAVSAALTLPGVAVALSHSGVRDGYYASLVGVPSAGVAFHVRGHGKIPDLSLGCAPATPNASAATVDIAVHAPVLTLNRGGRFS